jgi:ATP-binding cassette subfamily F protein 3
MKRAQAEARQRSYARRKPLADELARLEREIEALAQEKQALEAWLASPDAYIGDAKDSLSEKLARQGDIHWQLARLEARWLELCEALDAIAADPPSAART